MIWIKIILILAIVTEIWLLLELKINKSLSQRYFFNNFFTLRLFMKADVKNEIAIIIPTWRRVKQLTSLLNSLRNQIRDPDEIIVACRWNDEESIKVVKEWAHYDCKLARVCEEGHLPPLLKALEISESDIVCLIDDDAVPNDDWIDRIGNHFLDPRIGCIGGCINMYEPTGMKGQMEKAYCYIPSKLSWFGRSYNGLPTTVDTSKLYEADCFGGSNIAFRKTLVAKCIDPTLNIGDASHYETDIALCIKKMGFRVLYDPKLIVNHYAAPRVIDIERGRNAKASYFFAHNLTYVCLKHLRWYGKLAFLIYYFIGGQWRYPALATYILSLFSGKTVSFKEQLIPSFQGRFAGIKTYIRYLKKNHHPIL
jgi:GT2 family glycosyltransferase